jgi:hypothetical protein
MKKDKKGGGVIVWKDSVRKDIPYKHNGDQGGEEVGGDFHDEWAWCGAGDGSRVYGFILSFRR